MVQEHSGFVSGAKCVREWDVILLLPVQERIDILQRAEAGHGVINSGQSVAEMVSLVTAAVQGPARLQWRPQRMSHARK